MSPSDRTIADSHWETELALALSSLRDANPTLPAATRSGQCDAFALALCDVLAEHGLTAGLLVMQRQRFDAGGRLAEEDPLVHVVVEVGLTDWDIGGSDAYARCEEAWAQPAVGEDRFAPVRLDEPGLVALRQAHSQRPPDTGLRARVARQLRKCWTLPHPSRFRRPGIR